MSKKLLALLLAMIMIVGSFTSVLAETTTPADDKKENAEEVKTEEKKDEKSEEPAKTEEKKEEKKEEEPAKDEALERAIKVLKKAGFITGYSADSDDFKVEKNVKRSEFASMIVRAMGLEASAKALATIPTGFKDVPTNHWANGYIAVAKQQGFVNGYTDGTFRPDRQISYQDMATMLTIALGQAEVGTVYPAGYVVKAQQLGLFQGVKVPAYTDMATRGDVFKMLYNMITSKEFGERKILKAIVLENSRVEKMDADEVVVEVIKVVQEANWVGASRDKRGDQHKYKLDKDLKLDAEDMLGKVYDITVNKDDEIVSVSLDKTYNYFEGKITSVDEKKFGLNWNKYTALFDERYASEDERIFRTYLNDKDYTYEDFARKYDGGKYDYARLTVKNGKVIFIDAYQFDDIAPVAEVKDGTVYYYDDSRNAEVIKASNLGRVVFNTANGFTVGDKKSIVKYDVLHFYDNYRKAIVKKDAQHDQVLTNTHRDVDGTEWAVLEDKSEYELNYAPKFKAIYSWEGKKFEVLTSRKNLVPVTGRKVKLLEALDGSAQLIESDLQWNDGINAIRKITSSGDVQYLPPTGDTFWAKEGRGTYYWYLNGSNNINLHSFHLNDIVYFSAADKEEIGTMGLIATKSRDNIIAESYMNMLPASMNGRYITLNPGKLLNKQDYRYFDNLHAYYLDKWGNLQQVGDINKFIVDNAGNKELKAWVMSENELRKQFEKLDIDYYHFLSDADFIANIVVFNEKAVVKSRENVVYAEVVDKENWTNMATFVDADNNTYHVELTNEGLHHSKYKEFDIVELHIHKDTADKDVKVGYVDKVVIDANQPTQKISTQVYNQTYLIGGVKKYFDADTQKFDRVAGDNVQVYYVGDNDNWVRVIRYFRDPIYGEVEEETIRCILKDYDEDTNQFEVDYVNGKVKNKWFKIRTNPTDATHFVGVDKDGNVTHDYGFGLAGLEKFIGDFKNGTIKVTVDERDKDIAVYVEGFLNEEQLAKAYVKEAKEIVEALGKQEFAAGTEDKASNTPRTDMTTGNIFRQKAIDKLIEAGYIDKDDETKGKVRVKGTTPVAASGSGATYDPAHLDTVIFSNYDNTIKETARNDYSIRAEKNENQAKLDAVKPELADHSFGIPASTTPENRVKELVEAELKTKNIEYNAANLKVTVAPTSEDNIYTAVVTYGTTGNEASISFEIGLVPPTK